VVQEGTAFCANCNAPQIRVAMPETDSPSFEPGTPGEMQPPAQPVSLSSHPPLSPTAIDWRTGGMAVLTGGLLGGAAFFLPLNLFWIVIGGAVAVWLYNRRRPPYMQVSSGTGAKLGAVSGVVGYLLFAIEAMLYLAIESEKVWAELSAQLKIKAGANPEANVQQMLEVMKTPQGKAMLAVFLMVVFFAVYLTLATIGGAIGAAVVKRDQHPHQ
jgi:hypothetical protein